MRKIMMIAAGAAVLSASPAFAATEDATMPVSANVLDNCTISASPMAFGTLTNLGTANIDSTSSISVNCTLDASYDVSMDAGENAVGTQRNLESAAGDAIPYSVSTTAARADSWDATNTVSGTGSGAVQTLTAYGRIPNSATAVVAGTYADNVTVTVTF